jgi:hypothetical protein
MLLKAEHEGELVVSLEIRKVFIEGSLPTSVHLSPLALLNTTDIRLKAVGCCS